MLSCDKLLEPNLLQIHENNWFAFHGCAPVGSCQSSLVLTNQIPSLLPGIAGSPGSVNIRLGKFAVIRDHSRKHTYQYSELPYLKKPQDTGTTPQTTRIFLLRRSFLETRRLGSEVTVPNHTRRSQEQVDSRWKMAHSPT